MGSELRDLAQSFSETDWPVLERLNETGAATATDLAVRLRKMTEVIAPKLKEFQAKGLVEATPLEGVDREEIYRVSDKGRKVLRLVQLVR